MGVEQSTAEIVGEVFEKAKVGSLKFDDLHAVLAILVNAGNHPLAALLLSSWCQSSPKSVPATLSTYEAVAKLADEVRAKLPDTPGLPPRLDCLRVNVADREIEYRDITDPTFIAFFHQARKHSISMLGGAEPSWAAYKSVEYIVRNRIPGDFVECGVWNGGQVLLMALALRHFGDTTRRIYLYDTFEGMPKPDEVDRDWNGNTASWIWQTARDSGGTWGFGGTLDEVRKIVFSSGYPEENFVFVKGLVENTLPMHRPDSVALLRLDTDLYSSTYHELVHLYPMLNLGGILIIDDYGYFKGSQLATDKYFSESGIPIFLSRVDASVRLAVRVAPR